MEAFEEIDKDNKNVAKEIEQLSDTEDSRLLVITSIFIRANDEMRIQSVKDIKKDISYGAKDFGQLPEVYASSMDSIVKSYIAEINRFMKAYNDEFKNIQDILKSTEEKQKYYFYKIRECIVMKKICFLAGKTEDDCKDIDDEIKKYKRKLNGYEKVISLCDKRFEECKVRREKDFKDLFEIKKEEALVVVNKKQNLFIRLINKLKNKFNGYENFSKFVLQKHSAKINRIKTDTINTYINKEKQNIVDFSNEIDELLES